jgi:dienelactone hydrolase/uncharacterized protein (DUF2141 family)
MRISRIAKLCLPGCLFFASAAQAATVTLTVEEVKSGSGRILASLCGDRAAAFPGACMTYSAKAEARAGATTLVFQDVAAGRYAIQIVHDENGNNRPDFPQEGFGFGNNMPFPPNFEGASIAVTGDTEARVRLVHMLANGSNSVETKGAPPPAGVSRIDLRDNGLYGELYVPVHNRPLPLLIAIGGSEGGLDIMSSYAADFARQGYAVLALAWWKAPGLPQTLENIPLEYFDRAIAWAQARPEIAGDRIAMLGWSRGAEAALLTASRNPAIRAVVGVAPSAYVWQGLDFANPAAGKPAWTVAGKPLAWIAPGEFKPGDSYALAFTRALAAAERAPDAAIPVERIGGPVLLLSGSQDRLWPADVMAERIVSRLREKRFAFAVEHKNHADAGHSIFTGNPANAQNASPAPMDAFMGGSPQANAAARADSWTRVLRFLDAALRR